LQHLVQDQQIETSYQKVVQFTPASKWDQAQSAVSEERFYKG